VRFLGDIDVYAGVDAIYASASKRAVETVEPLAKHLGIDIRPVKASEVDVFAKHLIDEHKGRIVLLSTRRGRNRTTDRRAAWTPEHSQHRRQRVRQSVHCHRSMGWRRQGQDPEIAL